MRRQFLHVLLIGCLAAALPAAHAQGALTPAQSAWAKAESRNVEDRFVAEVAAIVGVPAARVREAMPDERRITATVARLLAALEQDLGEPLGEAQKAAIHAADERRKRELAAVGARAAQR